ncbi:MAG TPA: metal-dependent transcriptional regulator [Bacilli bacterium]|nr:metal-dependent transcriptional regulator [Bacilli bacterium]
MKEPTFESQEDYLEYILIIQERQPFVRSIDIVNETGYSKPSISRAVHLLENQGFIVINGDGHIILTRTGNEKAQHIYERHKILTQYFIGLGVSAKQARTDACRVEHVISEETFQAIKGRLS